MINKVWQSIIYKKKITSSNYCDTGIFYSETQNAVAASLNIRQIYCPLPLHSTGLLFLTLYGVVFTMRRISVSAHIALWMQIEHNVW